MNPMKIIPYGVFPLVFVELGGGIADGFLFEASGELRDGEPGRSARNVLLKGVVNELVLLL